MRNELIYAIYLDRLQIFLLILHIQGKCCPAAGRRFTEGFDGESHNATEKCSLIMYITPY